MEADPAERLTLEQIRVLVAIAQEGGVTSAARALGVSKSTVSRQLSALEASVGVELVERGPRSTKLTSAGASFYERALEVLDGVLDAVRAAHTTDGAVRGHVHVTSPGEYAQLFASEALASFASEHPAIELTIELTERAIDLERERVDVALCLGAHARSEERARRIHGIERWLVASPEYASRAGLPAHPSALSEHELVGSSRASDMWSLSRSHERIDVALGSARVRTNGWSSALECALTGLGVALLPQRLVEPHVERAELVRLLETWSTPHLTVWARLTPTSDVPSACRALVEHIRRAHCGTPRNA